jgi:hypothetical protein
MYTPFVSLIFHLIGVVSSQPFTGVHREQIIRIMDALMSDTAQHKVAVSSVSDEVSGVSSSTNNQINSLDIALPAQPPPHEEGRGGETLNDLGTESDNEEEVIPDHETVRESRSNDSRRKRQVESLQKVVKTQGSESKKRSNSTRNAAKPKPTEESSEKKKKQKTKN